VEKFSDLSEEDFRRKSSPNVLDPLEQGKQEKNKIRRQIDQVTKLHSRTVHKYKAKDSIENKTAELKSKLN
jgi:hypothetical protein